MNRIRSAIVLALVTLSVMSTMPLFAVSAQGCTWTELYPGYPEFQGFVTGVLGAAEYMCIEDLESDYGDFSVTEEDAANLAAAQVLGISGSITDFTWENWVVIESHRGLATTCWSCAFLSTIEKKHFMDESGTFRPVSGDQRLVGWSWDDFDIYNNINQQSTGGGMSNLELRVHTSIAYGDPYLNASELVNLYPTVVAEMDTVGGTFIYTNWDAAAELWGGHFPVPGSARPSDQIFFMQLSLFGAFGLNDAYKSAMRDRISQEGTNWELALDTGETTVSFREWLSQHQN